MEFPSQPAAALQSTRPSGFLDSVAWFFSGAVLPLGSLSFYRSAARRSVGLAVLFFIVFTVFISILMTVTLGISLGGVVSYIHEGYASGRVPAISITNGIAEVDGPQPWVLFDDNTQQGGALMAVDTSGRLTEIDQSRYVQGLLITRTEMHVLNAGARYQRMPLSELNMMFGRDPLVIDERTMTNAWVTLSAGITILALIGLVLWNTVVRLMFIAMLALVLWGIGSLLKPKVGYGPFIITGLYAAVPAFFLARLLSRSQASFLGLETLLLVPFWAVGLVAALSEHKFFSAERPLRLWTALIGVPMVLWFIVDAFANLPSPGAQIALWALTSLTIVALIGVRVYFRLPAAQPVVPAGPLPPPS